MSKIVLFPNTLSQLEAIKHHAKSSLSGDHLEDQIWLEDITAINNAIEIIKAYQNQALKKENILESPIIKRVKEYIEELKGQIREQLAKEPEEIELYTLEKTITDLDFYILAEELKVKKKSNAI